jgi:hypothetical protein
MKTLISQITKPEYRIARISLVAAGILIGIAIALWLLVNYWPVFLFGAACAALFHLYGRARSGINIADGVTVTADALTTYLRRVVSELEWDVNPEIEVYGWGDHFVIKLRVDFPTDPSRAADFHSQVIYVKGYLSRRLEDDFRIIGAKVEIEAMRPSLVRARR